MTAYENESEIQSEAENAAIQHFQSGRDKYETLAEEIIEMIAHPKHGLPKEQHIGSFIRGIALNNFYYGYLAGKRSAL